MAAEIYQPFFPQTFFSYIDAEKIKLSQFINLNHFDHIIENIGAFRYSSSRIMGKETKESFLILQKTQKNFIVQSYLKKALLVSGKIYPIGPCSHLVYDQKNELSEHFTHWLKLPLHQTIFFKNIASNINYQILKGPQLEAQPSTHASLESTPLLIQALKKLEAAYFNIESDPIVVNLSYTIEKYIQSLNLSQNHTNNNNALELLRTAKYYYENVFPMSVTLQTQLRKLELTLLNINKQNPIYS
jgi:hypothetical protein